MARARSGYEVRLESWSMVEDEAWGWDWDWSELLAVTCRRWCMTEAVVSRTCDCSSVPAGSCRERDDAGGLLYSSMPRCHEARLYIMLPFSLHFTSLHFTAVSAAAAASHVAQKQEGEIVCTFASMVAQVILCALRR